MSGDNGGRTRFGELWLTAAAVCLSFVVDSFARHPVPGPNEPHYLCKARHYWDPAWCAGDLFLSSANAHLVFYQTFGWLTRGLSLEASAVIGRVVGLAILAIGWTALVGSLVAGRWARLWAAWIFLAISAMGSLSGEWLVGGIESKVVAYGLLFAAAAVWMRGALNPWRPVIVGVLVGVAISFHPVVGIWGLAAALFATAVRGLLSPRIESESSEALRKVRWPWFIAGALLAAITATPGIIAGARSAAGSSGEADYIQVYYRLAHHLDPLHFGVDSQHFWTSPWFGYGVLAVLWLIGRRGLPRDERARWFFWLVIGSALTALCGLIAGWRTGPPEHMRWYAWRWKLLKLYPFRLFDALLPIAVAITAAGLAARWCGRVRRLNPLRAGRSTVFATVLCVVPALIAVTHRAPDARPPLSDQELVDWLDACRWIKQNTPANALVLTPTQESWAFKWFAERAEFVSYKDCPQDGPGIVAWNRRLQFLAEWSLENINGFSEAATTPLYTEHGITHILTMGLGPFTFEPVYRNGTFRIYRLDDRPQG